MVADTDLVNGKVSKPQNQNVHITKATIPPKKKSLPSPMKKAKFCLLIVANIILLSYLYNHFAPETFPRPWENIPLPGKNAQSLDFLTSNNLDVTGIMYYDENPAAIVSGKVVHEGDALQNCKVVKIHKDKVDFLKDGKHFTKSVSK